MNITLSVDEQVAARAREAAKKLGKSLNRVLRDYRSSWQAVLAVVKVGNSLSSAVYRRTLSSAAGSSIVMKPTGANQMAARSFIDTNVLIYAKASAQLAG